MPDAFTCKSFQLGESRTPQRIELLGDKTKRPEPATHIIEFPGGAIELSRVEDGLYWAHIIVNRSWALAQMGDLRLGAIGQVVDSRIDRGRPEIDGIADADDVRQIAVLIRVERPTDDGLLRAQHPTTPADAGRGGS